MTYRSLGPLARRLIAALALLTTMSTVAAPVCAAMAADRAPTDHCAPADNGQAPDHLPPICLLGACAPLPPVLMVVVSPGAPTLTQPVTAVIHLTSAAPQHAPPPPRS
ncbi:MAG: hypothetical protein ABJB33_09405 [Gemmatimonadota bacterium]